MKTLSRIRLTAAVAILALLDAGGTARADAAGDAVLAQMDAAMNKAKTLKFQYESVSQEPGKPERTMQMQVRIKGQKKLTELVAPADMKGTKVLVLAPSQIYVYLPAFGKVRRIASNVTDQGLMGLAFSQDDLAATSYGPQYTAAIATEDPATWKLVLTPKAGQATTYAKIEITVRKDKKVPSELKYFTAAGKNIKTETRTNYSCDADVCTPGELKMTDNTRAGAWTKLVAKARQVNMEISDDVFTQRSLGE